MWLWLQKTAECRRLKVKQHMLEVVQRVPKYLFLLKDYSSHLSDQSPDKQEAHGMRMRRRTRTHDVIHFVCAL